LLAEGTAGAAGSDEGVGLGSLAELLADRDEALLIVVDDAHLLSAEAADDLGKFVGALPVPHHVVVAGQAAPAWRTSTQFSMVLDWEALAFTAEEAGELAYRRGAPLTGDDAEGLVEATRGWPAAVTLAVAAQLPDAPRSRGVADLVGLLMARLDPSLRWD